MKFAKKSAIASKKNLIVNLYIVTKYLKGKIKSYKRKINTDFHDKKMPKKVSQCISYE